MYVNGACIVVFTISRFSFKFVGFNEVLVYILSRVEGYCTCVQCIKCNVLHICVLVHEPTRSCDIHVRLSKSENSVSHSSYTYTILQIPNVLCFNQLWYVPCGHWVTLLRINSSYFYKYAASVQHGTAIFY